MRKQYVVRLSEEERAELLTLIGQGTAPARAQTHARIRLTDRATVEREVAARVAERNAAIRTINWRFTTDDARIKLDYLYPVFHD
jgi:hypothetical protein